MDFSNLTTVELTYEIFEALTPTACDCEECVAWVEAAEEELLDRVRKYDELCVPTTGLAVPYPESESDTEIYDGKFTIFLEGENGLYKIYGIFEKPDLFEADGIVIRS